MLSSIKQRLDREDEGFTLIELMVVVLIIAILLAIAIPTFLGARNTANQRGVQSTLRNALTAEQTYFTNNSQVFASTATGAVSSPAISTVEPNIQWLAAAPATKNGNAVEAVTADSGASVFLFAEGQDGKCYSVFQTNSGTGSTFTTGYNVSTSATCPSTSADPTIAQTVAGSGAQANAGSTDFYTSW